MWELYDYIDVHGVNVIKEWSKTLQKPELARLNRKLEVLAQMGPDLPTGLLAGTGARHIDKLRITGKVTIRLLLCRGPIKNKGEFTLLFGAFERDRKLVPRDAEERAESHRIEILRNPFERRCKHERVG